jgi:hypothetical protein
MAELAEEEKLECIEVFFSVMPVAYFYCLFFRTKEYLRLQNKADKIF